MENGYTTLDAEVTPISRSSAAMGGALQAPATAYCERLTGWATRWSYWNDALFRFYTAMNFCFNWDQVWDVESLGSWAEVYYPGWEYMSGDTWGYWDNYGYAHKEAHAHFALCFAFCVGHQYPWLQLYGYADGTWDVYAY